MGDGKEVWAGSPLAPCSVLSWLGPIARCTQCLGLRSPLARAPPPRPRPQVLDLDPITVDEAIEAMEAVGHDFYVFREMESDQIQVGRVWGGTRYGV